MDALYNAAKPRVVAIGGPTATGKTALSVALAKRFGGEIISADSMQIYQGLDVGTAKVTPEEMQGVPHHLVGFLAPEQAFSVADFTTLAGKTITQLTAQGKLPLVVGGTGLYITSLLNGIGFTPEKVDPAIRQELQARLQAEGSQALYAELAAVDPGYAAKVHPNNTPRVIRALELYRATGRKMSAEREAARPAEKPYRSLCLCLTCRDRTLLYQRIDTRCDRMMQSGILEEAKLVYDHRDTYRTAAQAIGYKEFFPYPQTGGVRFSGVRGVMWPVHGFQSYYDLKPTPASEPKNPFMTETPVDVVGQQRLYPLVTEDKYYVFTEAFYRKSDNMTVLEGMVRNLIEDKLVNHPELVRLVNAIPYMPPLERYYFTPFILMLLRAGAIEP